jgi:hypothetical protein
VELNPNRTIERFHVDVALLVQVALQSVICVCISKFCISKCFDSSWLIRDTSIMINSFRDAEGIVVVEGLNGFVCPSNT